MEHKTFVLKENNEAIRNTIQDARINVCPCTTFNGACWLDYSTRVANGVHGVGYIDAELIYEGIDTQEKALARFVAECKNDIVVCKDVDEFIEMIKPYNHKHP